MFTTLALILASIVGIGGLAANAFIGDSTNTANQKSVADTNESNMQMQRETNQTNVAIANATNQANAEQAEIAYQRSLPANQVANMVAAGMSKSAALQSLSGGGSYSAPVMQSIPSNSSQNIPFQKIANMLDTDALSDALSGFASNTMQEELNRKNIESLNQEMEIRANQERRNQDLFDYQRWLNLYGKDSSLKLDAASNLVMNKLIDSGKDVSNFKSFESMIRELGLNNSKEIRELPYMARENLYSSIRERFTEYRAQREQENSNRASLDQHLLSELNRKDLKNRINDYNSEKNAREKEYKLRELRADIDTILAQDGLSLAEYQHSLEFTEDGSVRFSRKVSERAKRAWDRLADTIGIGVLRDLIRGVVTIAK